MGLLNRARTLSIRSAHGDTEDPSEIAETLISSVPKGFKRIDYPGEVFRGSPKASTAPLFDACESRLTSRR